MSENEKNEEQIEETPAAPESSEETPVEAETPVSSATSLRLRFNSSRLRRMARPNSTVFTKLFE